MKSTISALAVVSFFGMFVLAKKEPAPESTGSVWFQHVGSSGQGEESFEETEPEVENKAFMRKKVHIPKMYNAPTTIVRDNNVATGPPRIDNQIGPQDEGDIVTFKGKNYGVISGSN